MKNSKLHIIVSGALLIFCAPLFSNEIYKTVDDDGNVVYTDTPRGKKVEAVDLPTINTQPPTEYLQIRSPQETKEEPVRYNISITQPSNETVIPPGQQNVSVSASISPQLQENHQSVLIFNGNRQNPPQKTPSFLIPNISRGEHTLQVIVINQNGKTVSRSKTTKIYVIRPNTQQ